MNLLNSKSGRSILVFACYFAEGAPIGFIWWAMPTLLRQHQIGVDKISNLTAILTLPWVFKFLWAPLVDRFRSARFGFVHWIAWPQIIMCLTLLPLVFISLADHLMWWGFFLFLHSLAAATQDVSVDALVINVIPEHERGILNGYMQAGMLMSRSIFGGAALMFIPSIGLPLAIALMIICILSIMLLLFLVKEPQSTSPATNSMKEFKNSFKSTFSKNQTWYTIGFALTGAAAFEAAGGLSGSFFTDKHIDSDTIGFFFGVPVVVVMLLGGMLGGFISDKVSRKKAVLFFLLSIVLTLAGISLTDVYYPGIASFSLLSMFVFLYFFVGMFTAASYALFMDVTNPNVGATEFSTFMAATNGCEAWVVWCSGILVVTYSYHVAFFVMCIVSLLSLFFLRNIKFHSYGRY